MNQGKRAMALLLAATSVVLLASACSSSKSKSGGSSSSSTAKAPAANLNDMAPAARTAVKDGGSMSWALESAPPNWNYYEVDGTLQDTSYVLWATEPRPFHFDSGGVPTVNHDYFDSISVTSTNPLVIDYKINPKAKWSDGTALSWQDFYGMWKANNGSDTKFNVSGTQGFDQIGDVKQGANAQEAIITFAHVYADWQSLFDPFLPNSLTKDSKTFNTAWSDHPLVTAAAFKWGSQDKTAKTYTVVKDPSWWGDPAKLDSITFKVYNDVAAAIQALPTHQVDWVDIGPNVQYFQTASGYSSQGIVVRRAGGPNYRQFTLNKKDPTLSDDAVRQALFLTIDRARITTALIGKLGGSPQPLQNHLFLPNQTAYQKTCGDYCTPDVTKAKALLDADGWKLSGQYREKNGKELDLAITIPSSTPTSEQESELSQAMLAQVGIKLTITVVPTDDFFSKYITVGKFQLTTFSWLGTQFPVGSSLSIYSLDPKNVQQNYGSGGNDTINADLKASLQAGTQTEENSLANKADAEIWKDASWLPLYQRPELSAMNSQLVNLGAYGFADLHFQDIGFKK